MFKHMEILKTVYKEVVLKLSKTPTDGADANRAVLRSIYRR